MSHNILIVALAVFLFGFSCPTHGTEVTAFFKNNTPLNLTLNYYSSMVGTFIDTPPQNIGPFSMGTWRLSGSILGKVGWVQYDVYYQPLQRIDPTKTYSCVQPSYMWDLVMSDCESEWIACPVQPIAPVYTYQTCAMDIVDQCDLFGNPIHVLRATSCT